MVVAVATAPPSASPATFVALAHDYLTQRGGAERVVLTLAKAFPGAPIYTSLYQPEGTFPEFRTCDIRVSPLNAMPFLRRRHRLALPLLAPIFSSTKVDAEVTICSSSGWSHGVSATGRKVVYCHAPARWLYQPERYLAGMPRPIGFALETLRPALRRWDRRAAATADRYLVNSTFVKEQVAAIYGIDAEVVHPPVAFDPSGPVAEMVGVEPGFFLCVSRLLVYKNVGAVIAAFRRLPRQRLIVVGAGPLAEQLAATAPSNVTLVGQVDDTRLRWLYMNCQALFAASYEDFGLTPIEAAACGKPTAALRWGGFLDTIVPGITGVFFERPESPLIAAAAEEVSGRSWDVESLRGHAERFSPARFAVRLQEVVGEEASLAG